MARKLEIAYSLKLVPTKGLAWDPGLLTNLRVGFRWIDGDLEYPLGRCPPGCVVPKLPANALKQGFVKIVWKVERKKTPPPLIGVRNLHNLVAKNHLRGPVFIHAMPRMEKDDDSLNQGRN